MSRPLNRKRDRMGRIVRKSKKPDMYRLYRSGKLLHTHPELHFYLRGLEYGFTCARLGYDKGETLRFMAND